MSTDQQRYSLQAQSEAIHAYAERHGLEIVRSYVDAGKSGTTLEGRDGLKALISDVVNGQTDFEAVIVLDVSRWGRFPDPDQAAYYEFMCRQAGVNVHYCAEAFLNEDTMAAAVMKHLKRVMAGEYSRELSAKVAAGKRLQVKLGFRQGSAPPYGLRRVLIDRNGTFLRVLRPGERKGMSSDRVALVHGPEAEIRTVRAAFRKFIEDGEAYTSVARQLSRRGAPPPRSGRWTASAVRAIVHNEIYRGIYVYGKTVKGAGQRQRARPADDWIAVRLVDPIVSKKLFEAAQRKVFPRRHNWSRAEIIERLQALYAEHGYISKTLLNSCPLSPSDLKCRREFGSMDDAYCAAGLPPSAFKRTIEFSDEDILAGLCRLWCEHGYVSSVLIRRAAYLPSPSTIKARFGGLLPAYRQAGLKTTPAELMRIAAERAYARITKKRPGARGMSDDQLIELLRRLWRERGLVTRRLIFFDRRMPSVQAYRLRFGSILNAYAAAGLPATREGVGAASYKLRQRVLHRES